VTGHTYRGYTADAAGNLSAASSDLVTVNPGPVAILSIYGLNNMTVYAWDSAYSLYQGPADYLEFRSIQSGTTLSDYHIYKSSDDINYTEVTPGFTDGNAMYFDSSTFAANTYVKIGYQTDQGAGSTAFFVDVDNVGYRIYGV
jgi:hypothetical protein